MTAAGAALADETGVERLGTALVAGRLAVTVVRDLGQGATRKPGLLEPGAGAVLRRTLAAGAAHHHRPDPCANHGSVRALLPDRPVRGPTGRSGRAATTPSASSFPGSALNTRLADRAAAESALVPGGRVAVTAPGARVLPVAQTPADRRPAVSWGDEPDLEQPVVVLTARRAKGLEFDGVLVADPQAIIEESGRGPK
ncbi:MAG TPA: hypothetical protein VI248_10275 [Kineosporiaceae bacterium]